MRDKGAGILWDAAIAGGSDVTLYKVGEKRVCAKCREEHNEKDS